MGDEPKIPVDAPEARRRRVAGWVKLAVAVIALGLLIAWVIANGQRVEVDWLVTETDGPLSVLLLVAAGLGGIIGAIFAIVIRRRSRRT